ncbi:MAG TPA: tyrosine-type recombinase/integrase [Pedomonas sp.]|uniref:site-specific integrase n=1 Tax=Pedomonas sp. TaxID=2976421 RepID=UPI002F3F39C1
MHLKRIKTVKRGKKTYHYYKGKDALVRLPDPATDPDGFMRKYAACERRKVEQTKRQETGSLRAMISLWKQSPDFRSLAASTQKTYGVMIDEVASLMDGATLLTIERRDVQLMMDKNAATPAKANLMLATLSSLYRWAIGRDYAKASPTKAVKNFDVGEHEPWPEPVLKAALESPDALFRRAVKLYLYTGQRSGDCCAMTWGAISNGMIRVRQQKTGKELSIPIHPELAAELDATPRTALTILTNREGTPMTQRTMTKWVAAFGQKLGTHIVPHGLRKNAVNELLIAGCSVAETAAITGQTYQLVEYYARQINQERMALQAIEKWNRYGTGTGKQSAKVENISKLRNEIKS